ncbi:MAG: FAD-dependent monooxygenase [Mariprofundaceae bacterium]|nr:FAD-dependent monooxygenase [Mariprofundaceae bacterium]
MKQQTKDFDAVIVGGGVIGGVLALQLAEQGYRIAIIEALHHGLGKTDPERVIALSYGSRCYLEKLGLWKAISDVGLGHIRHIEVREANNHGLVQMHATDAFLGDTQSGSIDALGYVVEIADMVAPIYAALEGKVTWFRPAHVEAMQHDADGVSITLCCNGETLTVTSSLLVGADGTHSQVRRMAGIGTHGWDHNRFGLVASVRCEHGHADTAYECFRSSGPLALLPLADDRFSIVWALAPQEAVRMMELPDRMFLKRLQRAADESVLPRSGRFESLGKRACFPLEFRVAKAYARSRIVLVGNAAHTVHPVGGQGMNLGLRDVVDLLAVLDSPLAKKDMGNPLLLTAYAEKRRADVLAVGGFTESMLAVFGNDLEWMRFLRSKALGAMQTIDPLKGELLRHASGITQLRKCSLVQLNQVVRYESTENVEKTGGDV